MRVEAHALDDCAACKGYGLVRDAEGASYVYPPRFCHCVHARRFTGNVRCPLCGVPSRPTERLLTHPPAYACSACGGQCRCDRWEPDYEVVAP